MKTRINDRLIKLGHHLEPAAHFWPSHLPNTEVMVAEKRMGKMGLRRYLRTDNDLYFSLRNITTQKELPLAKTCEQPFVYYQKGGLVMYAIRETLGEDRANTELRKLIFQLFYL